MSFFKCILIIVGVSLLAISCERVISVSTKDVAPQIVIEGIITDDTVCKVRISQTSNFNDTINIAGISKALISITEEGGKTIVLAPTSIKGVYRANFSGKPGKTYHLRVEYPSGGMENNNTKKVFTATSTMPQKVKLDSLYVTERIFLGKSRKIASLRFNDPPLRGNAYRFVQYVDGNEETTIFVIKDDLVNGRTVTNELLIFNDEYTLRKCDQLRVEMQCIDQPNYLYWYSLNQSALGSSQTASPGNPATNINGGALGYFSAHTVSVLNIPVFPDSSCSYPAKNNKK